MTSLQTCSTCAGFAPAAATICPHCDAALARTPRRFARVVAQLLGSASVAITLMACYGAVAHPYAAHPEPCADTDGDASCAPQDCDDTSAAVFPGAEDADGDGVDQNCDGVDGWRDPGTMADPAAPAESAAPAGPAADPAAPAEPATPTSP